MIYCTCTKSFIASIAIVHVSPEYVCKPICYFFTLQDPQRLTSRYSLSPTKCGLMAIREVHPKQGGSMLGAGLGATTSGCEPWLYKLKTSMFSIPKKWPLSYIAVLFRIYLIMLSHIRTQIPIEPPGACKTT